MKWDSRFLAAAWVLGTAATVAAAVPVPASAAPGAGPTDSAAPWAGGAGADRAAIVRTFAAQEAAREQPGSRAQIEVGAIAPYLRLAPCNRVEPFLYAGARLWGHGFVGLRCTEPGRAWSISVPVVVRYFGQALVATQAIPAFTPLSAAQFRTAEVDLTREPGGIATGLPQVLDHNLLRPIDAGQAVPLNALHMIPAVKQGDTVTVVGNGTGFSITTDAVALSSAGPGESVRVQTESGRILTGTARQGRVVELRF